MNEHTVSPWDDDTLTDTLRRMWEHRDPVPADLAARVTFALSLETFEAELMRLTSEPATPVGARGEDRARTVTFTSEHLSVMVTISDTAPRVRLDGWIGDGGGLLVGLRALGPGADVVDERSTGADVDGRFAFDAVPPGLVQLVFHPTDGARLRLTRPVVTPAVQV